MGQAATLLSAAMRWLHFFSLATLIGGLLYARNVFTPVIRKLAPETRDAIDRQAALRYRPMVFASIAGLLISGAFNLYTKHGSSILYQSLLGIKFMLVLHIFAVAFLSVQPVNPRRARLMTGAAISGAIVILISTYLGRIA